MEVSRWLTKGLSALIAFTLSLSLLAGCDQAHTANAPPKQGSFAASNGDWHEFYLEGDCGGSATFSSSKLTVTTAGGAKYGVYHSVPVSGHFYVEAAFEDDKHIGLALIQAKNGKPDIFCAFSTDEEIPQTYSGYNIEYEIAWQSTNGRHSHWPVSKRPFTGNNGSGGIWKAEVTHSCLLSCGVIKGTDWQDHFKIDKRGRKYRDWVSLVGTNEPADHDGLRDKIRSWLYRGKIKMLDKNCKFIKNDYGQKALVFENIGTDKICSFVISPDQNSSVLINPAVRINNWGPYPVGSIKINDMTLPAKKYRFDLLDGKDILIWMNITVNSKTRFAIAAK